VGTLGSTPDVQARRRADFRRRPRHDQFAFPTDRAAALRRRRRNASMNVVKAISLKVMSALLFAVMSALVRFLGETYPVGQIVFFRSAFAILPVLVIYAWRNELAAAVRTVRPLGQIGRGLISICGMFCNFAALARLPIVDATAISFVSPLITVAMSAIFLKERVRIYRWLAVIAGFVGILVMLGPHFDLSAHAGAAGTTLGLAFAIGGAFCNAGSVIQTRRLTETETTSSIVFYFSLICALAGLATWPLGWLMPTWPEFAALVTVGLCGGLAHILLTESYRLAPASVVAPFDYTAMVWAFLLGYFFFNELPTIFVFAGAGIIAGAGLFVIWRERQLGLQRVRAAEGPPTGT
jgi:drug/metabolite transporter (DMT)-like permease